MPPPRPAAPTIAVSAVQQLIVKHLDQLCKGDAHVAELAAQRTDLIAQLSSRDTTISGLTTQRAALLTLVSTEQLRLGELLLQAGLSAASTLAGQSSARPPPSRSPSRAVTKPRQAHSPTLVGMAGITGRSPQQQIRDEHIQPIVISDASGPPSVTPSPLRPSLATDAAPPHPILATISALTADLPTPGPSLPPANCNCTPGVSGARLICERRLQTSQRDGELTPTRRPPYVDVLSTIPGHQPSPFLIQSNEPIGPVTPPTPPVGDHPAPQFYDLSPADFSFLYGVAPCWWIRRDSQFFPSTLPNTRSTQPGDPSAISVGWTAKGQRGVHARATSTVQALFECIYCLHSKNRSASLPGERCAIDCNWSSSQPATAWRSFFKLRLETLLRLDTS